MRSAECNNDEIILSKLNAQFIKNFIEQNVAAHEKIIHEDFICIENSGAIVNRDDYLKAWAHDYADGNFTSFSYTDECIRIFGNAALVRSRTVYTKNKSGEVIEGNTIYTDTYVKQNGEWKCVQAQITPVQI
jgi:ketosteroid isomerase-like protein